MKKISIAEIQEALTPDYIRVSQIIFFSIMAGASFFLLVILFLFINGSGAEEVNGHDVELINMYSLVHAALFTGAVVLSGFLYNMLLRQDRMALMVNDMDPHPAITYLSFIRTAQIIRIAIIEVPVFFGLVTCFMAVSNRVMHEYPYYWANAISYGIFIVMLMRDFPTKDRITELFRNKLPFLLQF